MTATSACPCTTSLFYGAALADLETVLGGARRVPVEHPRQPIARSRISRCCCSATPTRVEAVYHLFAGGRLTTDPAAARDALSSVIDAAAGVGARTVYLLTGGRGALTWEQAAEQFCAMVAPCVEHANRAGVALAIENASSLYADIHLAHTLRDTITLAEMSGLGICIDLFHCWAEARFRSAGAARPAANRADPVERLRAG